MSINGDGNLLPLDKALNIDKDEFLDTQKDLKEEKVEETKEKDTKAQDLSWFDIIPQIKQTLQVPSRIALFSNISDQILALHQDWMQLN